MNPLSQPSQPDFGRKPFARDPSLHLSDFGFQTERTRKRFRNGMIDDVDSMWIQCGSRK